MFVASVWLQTKVTFIYAIISMLSQANTEPNVWCPWLSNTIVTLVLMVDRL